jgi:hypothetical protein
MPRKTKYKQEFAEEAYKQCLLGKTDKQLAAYFGVSESTLNSWKKRFPEFSERVAAGKDRADGEVVAMLYKRCMGYTIEERTGEPKKLTKIVQKHVLPDITAIMFWLRTRKPLQFKEFDFGMLSNEQLDFVIEKLKQQKPQSNE